MRREGTLYTIIFSVIVCGICSILVSGAAVGLKERQKQNQVLDRQSKVLILTGLIQPGERLGKGEIQQRFKDNIEPRIVTLKTGEYDDNVDVTTYDQRKATDDPGMSEAVPDNPARVLRVPHHALIYLVMKDGKADQVVLPVHGKGLWSTMYGYLALDKDTTTVRGLTFYEHGETPGLGGEIENPRWKALWPGRKAFDENWKPDIHVIKGQAGAPEADPHQVDGLSGATLTSRGVGNLIMFWLGDHGFGPYLQQFRQQRS